MKKTLFASLYAVSAAALAQAAPAAAQDTPMGIGVWIAGIVLVGGAGLFVFRMLNQKDTPANPPAPKPVQQAAPAKARTPAPVPAQPPGVTGDFDVDGFLRQSKASFVRMQAAWDKADTNDLREFTTPEVFAELKAQVEARGQTTDVTEVVQIEAELLGIETVGERELASVKFVGLIKSSAAAPAEPFSEIWNLARPRDGSSGWMLAGIQQLS